MPKRSLITGTDKTKAMIAARIASDPRLVSPHTARGYLADLNAFEDWRQGRPVSKLLVEEYAAHLQAEGKSGVTINRALSAIRWWARKVGDMALEDGSLDKEEREEIARLAERAASVQSVKAPRAETGRHIPAGELKALIDACARDEGPAGVRDSALIALAWATGARRAELARLTVADCQSEGESEYTLTIRKGKGGKTRRLPVLNGAADALADWLSLRGERPGPVFCPIAKGGKVELGQGLTGEGLRLILDKRQAEAGITRHITWHDFRRTFAGEMITAADVSTARLLLGHERADTTVVYDRRGAEVQRKALQALHVPYVRRG